MRLIVNCKACGGIVQVRKRLSDKGEFKMTYGNTIELKCDSCKKSLKYDVDKIRAKTGYLAVFVSVALLPAIVLIIYLLWNYNWYFIGSVYLIPIGLIILFSIYITIIRNEENKVSFFNRS